MKGQSITNKGIEALNERAGSVIFPLQTIQSMAERWGLTKQAVAMRAQRDPIFPRPLDGMIAETKGAPKVFALCDVKKYEKEKGLL
jgi:hypothetical protein